MKYKFKLGELVTVKYLWIDNTGRACPICGLTANWGGEMDKYEGHTYAVSQHCFGNTYNLSGLGNWNFCEHWLTTPQIRFINPIKKEVRHGRKMS